MDYRESLYRFQGYPLYGLKGNPFRDYRKYLYGLQGNACKDYRETPVWITGKSLFGLQGFCCTGFVQELPVIFFQKLQALQVTGDS